MDKDTETALEHSVPVGDGAFTTEFVRQRLRGLCEFLEGIKTFVEQGPLTAPVTQIAFQMLRQIAAAKLPHLAR
eukprot:5102637-Prorocentrum_lima.AAC.1